MKIIKQNFKDDRVKKLGEAIMKTIRGYAPEENMNYATVIGVLEIIKHDI